MQVDRAEFLRYLGWRGQETDDVLLEKLDEAAKRCLDIAAPRSTVRRFTLNERWELGASGFCLEGNDVRAHLAGCREVYLFAATLGAAAERELAKLNARSAYEALLFDTACSCAGTAWLTTRTTRAWWPTPARSTRPTWRRSWRHPSSPR